MRALLALAALLAAASAAVAAVPPALLRVGLFDWVSYWYSNPGVAYNAQGSQTVTVNFFLAAEMFNQRRADVIPLLGSPAFKNCPVNISIPRMCDTAGSSHLILDNFANLTGQYDALVGFASSAELFVTAQVADALMRWPVVNHWCSSPLLRQREFFPTLARTGQDDGEYAIPLCRLVAQLGYTQAALMVLVGDSGPAFHDSVISTCTSFGVDISAFDYQDSTPDSIEAALIAVKKSRLNVIIYHGYNSDYVIGTLPDQVVGLGMTGGNYLWIFTNFDLPASPDQMDTMPNVSALHGHSLRPAMTIPPNQRAQFNRWKDLWVSEFPQYVDSINSRMPPFGNDSGNCLLNSLVYQLDPGFFNETIEQAFEVWAFAADTVFTLGMAACNYSGGSTWDRNALYAAIMNVDFEGVSGHVHFDPSTGNRLPQDKTTVLQNWQRVQDEWTLLQVATYEVGGTGNFSEGVFVNSSFLITPLGPGVLPPQITPPVVEHDYLPRWMRVLGIFEASTEWVCCAVAFFYVLKFRNHPVIVNSQIALTILTILGCVMVSFASIALTVTDDPNMLGNWNVSAACMVAPLAFVLGFQVSLLALIGKSYRIWRIFNNTTSVPLRITSFHILGFILAIITIESAVSAAWAAKVPLYWQLTVTQVDNLGFPVKVHGGCEAPDGAAPYVAVLFTVHALALMASMFAARIVRDLPEEFQESKWIAYANLTLTQIYFLAVPTVAAVYHSPEGLFIVASTAVFLSVLGMLFFMIMPKVILIQTGTEMWAPSNSRLNEASASKKKTSQNKTLTHLNARSQEELAGVTTLSGSKFIDLAVAKRSAMSSGGDGGGGARDSERSFGAQQLP